MFRFSISLYVAMVFLSASLHPLVAQAQYRDDEIDVESETSGNASTARLQVRINEMEEQVRRLQGAVEQVSFSNRQLKTQIEKMRGDMDYRLSALEKSTPAGATTSQDASPPSSPSTEDSTAENREPNKYVPVQDTTPEKVQKFDSSHEHYSAAFKLLNQAKYAEASNMFSAFTQRYPKDPLIGNAFYWLGETYYVRKDYVKAADNFRQGYETMPTGPKASDNLLKLAMALSALGKDKDSCVVLKQVATKFGKTSGSVRARAEQEMNRMECR